MGFLTIQNGSTLTTAGSARIGSPAGTTVTVTGAGSQWILTSSAPFVGSSGNGTLNILNGAAVVAAGSTTVGSGAASSGTLNISGGGKLETNAPSTTSGTVHVNFDDAILRARLNNFTFINGFSGTQLNIAAGGLTVDTATFNVGTDATSAFTGVGGLIVSGGGVLSLLANNTYSGQTTIQAGTGLSLQGAGAIANSSGVIANGTFNVSGIAAAGTSVQRLAGGGGGVLGAKNVTITNANDVFSGVISGTGGLTLSGTQTLTGANTYTGGTMISAGTLQLGNGGTSGTIVGNVTDNGTLAFYHSDTVIFGGVISGTGGVTQIGSGTTLLTAADTYTGATTITGGTLSVNGSLASSAVTVMPGATLGGNGTVGTTTIQSGGTIAPGNSIGTLHINGSFTQASGSVYQLQVDPNSNRSDLIVVSGTTTLQSGAVLNVSKDGTGDYRVSTVYTVLTAAGGLTGTYTLSGDTAIASAFLGLRDSYDGNDAYLSVVQIRDPAQAAQTRNQLAVATSLPADGALTTAILNLPTDAAARSAFDQLSGEAHASTKGALLTNGLYVRGAIFDRLRDVVCRSATDGDPYSPACNSDRLSLWMQGFGGWGTIASSDSAAGLSHSTAGVLIGMDVPVADWQLGLFGGYSHSNFDGGGADGGSNDYHLGLYGGRHWGPLLLSLGASYSWNDIKTNRAVSFGDFADQLRANYLDESAQAFAELGYRFEAGRNAIEPFANVAYVHLHSDGFTEAGGASALTSPPDNIADTVTTFGLRPSATVMVGSMAVTLRGMIGWRHTFGTVTPTSTVSFAGGSPFSVSGAPIARDAAALEAGVNFAVRDNIGASLS